MGVPAAVAAAAGPAVALPAGLVMNPNTGIITGTPVVATSDKQPYVVVVTNAHGVAAVGILVEVVPEASTKDLCKHGGEASGQWKGTITCEGRLNMAAFGKAAAAAAGVAGALGAAAAEMAAEAYAKQSLSVTLPAALKAAGIAAALKMKCAEGARVATMCTAIKCGLKAAGACSLAVVHVIEAANTRGLATAAQRGAQLGGNMTAMACTAVQEKRPRDACTAKTRAAAEAWADIVRPEISTQLATALKMAACAVEALPASPKTFVQAVYDLEVLAALNCERPMAAKAAAGDLGKSVAAEAAEIMHSIADAASRAAEAGKKPDMNLADYIDPECAKRKPLWQCVAEGAERAKKGAGQANATKETQLDCTVATTEGSNQALTSCDVRDDVTVGDVVCIPASPTCYEVCPPLTGLHMNLNDTVASPSSTGLALTVRAKDPNAPAGATTCKRKAEHPMSLTEGVPLCGCVDVIKDSLLVRTKCDMRTEIADGETISITCGAKGTPFVSSVTSPRDSETLTITVPFPSDSADCCQAKKVAAQTDPSTCAPLPGTASLLRGSPIMRTTVDFRSELNDGDSIRVEGEEFIVGNPWDMTMLTLSRAWPLPSAPSARPCKVLQTSSRGKVSCCLTTVEGSDRVFTACDLRPELKTGASVKVRTETFTVKEPRDGTFFTIDAPSALPSVSCISGKKQAKCAPLPGTFGTERGSARVTSSQDIRAALVIGDTIELGEVQFDVVGPMDSFSFGVNRKWEQGPLGHMAGRKCVKKLDGGTPLCGTVCVFQGSRVVKTTCDMTPDLSPSDTVKIGDQEFQVVDPMDDCTVTLNRPYPDETVCGLKVVRLPLSEKQRLLEELAKKKMACLSIYCLAKLEEQERGIAFSLPRSLTVLNPEQWKVERQKSGDSAIGDASVDSTMGADPMQSDPAADKAARKAQSAMVMKAVNRTKTAVRNAQIAVSKARDPAVLSVARDQLAAAQVTAMAAQTAAAAMANGDRGGAGGPAFVDGVQAAKDAEDHIRQAKMGAVNAHMALENALTTGSPSQIRSARHAYGEAAGASASAECDLAVINARVAVAAAKETSDSATLNSAQATLDAASARCKAVTARNVATELVAAPGDEAAKAATEAMDRAATAAAAALGAAQAEKMAADYRGAAARRTGDPNKMKVAEEGVKNAVLKAKAADAAMKAAKAKVAYVDAKQAPETDEKAPRMKTAAVNADIADQKADDAQRAAAVANKPLTDEEVNQWRGKPPNADVDQSKSTVNPDGGIDTPKAPAANAPGGAGGPGGPGGPGKGKVVSRVEFVCVCCVLLLEGGMWCAVLCAVCCGCCCWLLNMSTVYPLSTCVAY